MSCKSSVSTKMPPSDTRNRQQRNSRVVPRQASEDNLWDAARDGVIVSADLDERMMVPKLGPSGRLPPYQQQEPAWPAAIGPPPVAAPPAPPQPPRPPLGDVTNANPNQVELLKKHIKLQATVIEGLCRLRVFEAEN